MTELEIIKLLPFAALFGLAVGLIVILPTIIKRLIKKEKVFPDHNPNELPPMKGWCILGIILFSGFAIASFSIHMPLIGCLFIVFALLNIVALKYFEKIQNGNSEPEP